MMMGESGRLPCWILSGNSNTVGSSIKQLTQEDPPTTEALDNLSDEQISDLLTRTRRSKNQAR
jgi:hypothetical protein